MKKLLALFLIVALLAPCVLAEEIDLSSFTFDELRELQTRISAELTKRPEWKQVEVPPGLYRIGVDIPAGDWCLKCGKAEYEFVVVSYDDKLNDSRTDLAFPCDYYGSIYQEDDGAHETFLNIHLEEGYYLKIQLGQVIFCPQEKIDLGF